MPLRQSPGKPDPKNDKQKLDEARRQFKFGVGYLITSLLFLWLFQVLVLNPLLTRNTEIAPRDAHSHQDRRPLWSGSKTPCSQSMTAQEM